MTPGIPTDVSYEALKEGEKNQSFLLGLIKMKCRAKVRKKYHITLSGASYILSKLIIGILPHGL